MKYGTISHVRNASLSLILKMILYSIRSWYRSEENVVFYLKTMHFVYKLRKMQLSGINVAFRGFGNSTNANQICYVSHS